MTEDTRVLTPGEVAEMFRVDPKTVTRWVADGKFPKGSWFKTPGGHLRFHARHIEPMVKGFS